MIGNLLNSVYFEEGCQHIPSNAIVIEIAPHGLLQAILKKSLPPSCLNVSLTYRSKTKENLEFLLASLGKYVKNIKNIKKILTTVLNCHIKKNN